MSTKHSKLTAKFILLGMLLGGQTVHAGASLGIGLNYNSGGTYANGYGGYGYGPSMFGYGYGGGGFGSVVNACGQAAAYPGYAYMPMAPQVPIMPQAPMPMPMLPPMPAYGPGGGGGYYPGGYPGFNPGLGVGTGIAGPIALPLRAPSVALPPHLAMANQGWGPNFASYPGPGFAAPSTCVPCNAGLQNVVLMPVPGGPALTGPCGAVYGSCPLVNSGVINGGVVAAGGGYSSGVAVGGGTTIIDMRSRNEWEKNDNGEIVWATALGLGMQASNVTPMAVPRYSTTFLSPTLWGDGIRSSDLIARPHGP